MAKHFTVDWFKVLDKYIKKSEDFVSELSENTLNYPSVDNFVMIASALLRLQDVYNLDTSTLSAGHINNTSELSTIMTADDCFQLGKVAYNNHDYYHAVLWFSEALRIDDIEDSRTTNRPLLLDYLSFSTFKQGNLRHAYNLTSEWLQLEPDQPRALRNLEHYSGLIEEELKQFRQERKVYIPDSSLKNERIMDEFRSRPEFKAYEKLCRGEALQTPTYEPTNSRLVCQYRRHVPMFYLRPLKEELVNTNPRIVFYRDVITESEIARVKQLAVPKLHRSGVFSLTGSDNPEVPGFTSYRTSKSAWLMDDEDPVIARLSRRAAAFSNLTFETSEDFQVLNYGIGGHYEPHYDFSREHEETQFDDWQGNRVATAIFYLNDVEAGGSTVFNLLGITQPASKGSCLLWYNLLTSGAGDFRTRHAGCPVLVGTKWVANKWFHYGGQHFSRPCGLREDE